MNRWVGFTALVILLVQCGLSGRAWAQDSTPDQQARTAVSEPQTPAQTPDQARTTQPAEPEHPRHSPRSMMSAFLLAIGESEKKPDRIKDAMQCLDLSALNGPDSQAVEQQGPTLARQLEQVIDALLNTYGKSLDELPEEPEEAEVAFPEDCEVQLVLKRSEDGLWQFAAQTVAAIPELLETVKQEQKQAEKEDPEPEIADTVPPAFRSARATMQTFLGAMDEGKTAKAARCLDLSETSGATQMEIGADLAERLLDVMDRVEEVVYQEIPDKPDGEPYSWNFGVVGEHGRIELARQEAGDRKGEWLFTTATVNSIEQLFKAFQHKPRVATLDARSFWTNPRLWILEKVPPTWKRETLGTQRWQWFGFPFLLALGYAVYRLAFRLLCAFARPFGRSKDIQLSKAHIASTMRPLGMLVMVATWWAGLRLLGIRPEIMVSVWPAIKLVMTVVSVWAFYRLIDLVADYVGVLAERTPSRMDDVLVPLLRKTLKIIASVVGAVFILKALNVEEGTLDTLFAGLGIGGFAFAFAAKDTIANFFGSITVVLDRPFQVGDWVKVGNVEGTVETVGLRSSRIRTFYNSQVTIPNSDLTTTTVDNMGRRRYRRISCKLSVIYSTTPDQLDAFCEGIRELIRRHPHTRKDYYLAWVNEFAASSIDILLYCFHETPDWVTELRERHRLFLDIIRLADRLGVEFAFPTQTIHLSKDDGNGTPAQTPKTNAAPNDIKPAVDPGNWGRTAAEEITNASLSDAAAIPPTFEFPKVDL